MSSYKLTNVQRWEVVRRYQSGALYKHICADFGITENAIVSICRHRGVEPNRKPRNVRRSESEIDPPSGEGNQATQPGAGR